MCETDRRRIPVSEVLKEVEVPLSPLQPARAQADSTAR